MDYGQWPDAGDATYKYTFQLQRNLSSIDDSRFEWIDYPGSALIADSPDVEASINEASCLVLIVNGKSFASMKDGEEYVPIVAKDESEYKQIVGLNLYNNSDLQAITQLAYMAHNGIRIPPVAVVITKRDLIPTEWRKYIADIVHEKFDLIFNRGVPVFVTSVTLGEEIERSGRAAPEEMEKPLFYALLSIFCKDIDDAKQRISDNRRELATKDTFFNRLFHQSMLDSLKIRIHDDEEKIKAISGNAKSMLKIFDDHSVFYVNGERTSLQEYFSRRLN